MTSKTELKVINDTIWYQGYAVGTLNVNVPATILEEAIRSILLNDKEIDPTSYDEGFSAGYASGRHHQDAINRVVKGYDHG